MAEEHPILFNGEMVRAVVAGRKTQTRRPVTARNSTVLGYRVSKTSPTPYVEAGDTDNNLIYRVRSRIEPGDLIVPLAMWSVHADLDDFKPTELPAKEPIWTAWSACKPAAEQGKLRPGMFLPLFLRNQLPRLAVRRVWFERVQDISEVDAIAEGMSQTNFDSYRNYTAGTPRYITTAKESFSALWDSIYAKRGDGWDTNLWVAACEFSPIPNPKP